MEPKLRLNEFKTLYKAWKRGIPWWDHLLLGCLWWIEEKIIEYRVKTAVDEAIKEYYSLHGELSPTHPPNTVPPVYRETPSNTSTSLPGRASELPEMRLTAPWYKESQDDVEGR